MRIEKGETKFKEEWLYQENYKDWLRKALSPHHGHCNIFRNDISVEK